MLYKKKTVNVRPQTIATTPVVEQHTHTHERDVVVERRGWSPEAVAMATIAGLILFGLLLYYLWYRPAYTTETPAVIERNNTVIEKSAPEPSTTIVTPPPVVNTPPPATDVPDVNITTPPVTIENNTVTPPAETESGNTDMGATDTGAADESTDAPPATDDTTTSGQ